MGVFGVVFTLILIIALTAANTVMVVAWSDNWYVYQNGLTDGLIFGFNLFLIMVNCRNIVDATK